MDNKAAKNQSALNRWLNHYFSVVTALFLILFLFLGYIFFIWPKMTETEEAIRFNLEQQKIIYTVSRTQLANLRALEKLYNNISPTDLQKFNSVLPDNYPPEKLFGELEEIIARGGWLLDNVALNVEDSSLPTEAVPTEEAEVPPVTVGTTNDHVGRISVDLTVSSIDYAGFKNLIRLLETNMRLFDITNVDFMPSEKQAKIVLTTYYYKRP